MHFQTLMAQGSAPNEISGIVGDLLVEKAKTREMGTGLLPRPPVDYRRGICRSAGKLAKGTAASTGGDPGG